MRAATVPQNAIAVPQKTKPTRILVVGAGAVGSFYGGRLAQAGAEVSTVHRTDHDIVKKTGIFVDSIDGNFHFQPQHVLRQAQEFSPPADYILVGLKVLPQIDTAQLIKAAVGPETTIFLLQNGIHIEESVRQSFPAHEVISGLAFVCVSRTSPSHIQHLCHGSVTIGRYPSGVSPAAEHLASLFALSKTPCTVSTSIVADRWRKLLWNASFNPISVLARATTKEIMDLPEAINLAQQVMEEVFLLAKADGYDLPSHAIEKSLASTRQMKPYKTSMLLDFESGRSMEIEAILGNALRTAREHKISVPHLETLYATSKLAAIKLARPKEHTEKLLG